MKSFRRGNKGGKWFGKVGAASKVRRLDPKTMKPIETLPAHYDEKIRNKGPLRLR